MNITEKIKSDNGIKNSQNQIYKYYQRIRDHEKKIQERIHILIKQKYKKPVYIPFTYTDDEEMFLDTKTWDAEEISEKAVIEEPIKYLGIQDKMGFIDPDESYVFEFYHIDPLSSVKKQFPNFYRVYSYDSSQKKLIFCESFNT